MKARSGNEIIETAEQPIWGEFQADLFFQFAKCSLHRILARIDAASGKGPLPRMIFQATRSPGQNKSPHRYPAYPSNRLIHPLPGNRRGLLPRLPAEAYLAAGCDTDKTVKIGLYVDKIYGTGKVFHCRAGLSYGIP